MQTEVLDSLGLDVFATPWILGLVFVFVALAAWSSFSQVRAGGSFGLSAKNLFLTVKAEGAYQVHILSLAPSHLTFVSPTNLAKGDKVHLDLQILPGFPEGSAPVEVEVTRSHAMRGEKNSFVISAKVPGAKGNTSLVRFLEQLARPGRLSHA